MGAQIITVFGGSGFLGRHVVRALARAGHRLRVAVRYPNRAHHLLPLGRVGQIQLMKADIRRAEDVRRALDRADAAVNLVGILFQTRRQRFDTIHAEAAGEIADMAKQAGARRLVHVSAIGADPDASSRYARSKGEGEARVRAAFAGATILRPSIVFGPEDEFFNRFAALARLLPVLPLIGGGTTRFQPVYAGDVGQAVRVALESPENMARIYELGGPDILTFREVLEYILRETHRKRLLIPVPFAIAKAMALPMEILPRPLLTRDQVELLKSDNVAAPGMPGLAELGITPTEIAAVVPSYLVRFRPRGQFDPVCPPV